jgi:hypothetical protein
LKRPELWRNNLKLKLLLHSIRNFTKKEFLLSRLQPRPKESKLMLTLKPPKPKRPPKPPLLSPSTTIQ